MTDQKKLESLRGRIDRIDDQLLELINERVRTAVEIGVGKASRGETVYRPEREAELQEFTLGHRRTNLVVTTCPQTGRCSTHATLRAMHPLNRFSLVV